MKHYTSTSPAALFSSTTSLKSQLGLEKDSHHKVLYCKPTCGTRPLFEATQQQIFTLDRATQRKELIRKCSIFPTAVPEFGTQLCDASADIEQSISITREEPELTGWVK